jgi:hypothetical protein
MSTVTRRGSCEWIAVQVQLCLSEVHLLQLASVRPQAEESLETILPGKLLRLRRVYPECIEGLWLRMIRAFLLLHVESSPAIVSP